MKDLNDLSYKVIGLAYKVHSELGPGLLESTYETCLEYLLLEAGFNVERQKTLPIVFWDVKLKAGYRIDLVVENKLLLEIKAVESLAPVYEAQLLTYLKLSKIKLGLMINFNVPNLKQEILRRII